MKRGARAVTADGLRMIARALEAGPPRDRHGLMPRAMRAGRRAARANGHDLTHWKRKPYAPHTAAAAFCRHCGAHAAVDVTRSAEPTGTAINVRCTGAK